MTRSAGLTQRMCGYAICSVLLATSAARAAGDALRLAVPTLAGAKIRLDGNLDEAAWRLAATISELTEHEPEPGAAHDFRTRILLFTDGESLFLGYDCYDPEPDKISTHALQRDGNVEGDDSVDFVLDTFGDRTTAYWFLVTAGGARADGLVSAANGGIPSLDWDGVWNATARRTATGWSAEVEVPARSLHFRRGVDGWGFNIARQIARRQAVLRWTAIPHDANFFDLQSAGRLDGLGGMEQGIGLAVAPFALAANSRARPRAAATQGQAGVDVSYSFTPELAGVLTYRTDFAETEVDTQQVNLTRFPLFFPEKRAFFVEGANQFEFGYGLEHDFLPFFSRRIGLFDEREVPLDGGLKVLGHVGPLSVGALGVRTRGNGGGAPAVDLAAGRFAYDLDAHWRVGTLFTHGDPDGRSDNDFAGFDVVYRTPSFRGDKNLVASLWGARSAGDVGPGKRTGWGARLDYPNDRWTLYGDVREFGDSLDPALGFLPRPGTRWYKLGSAFQPRPDATGPFSWARQFFFENYDYLITDLDGRTESWRLFLAPFNVVTQAGDHFEVNVVPYYERLASPFEISDGVTLPVGGYHFTRYRVQAEAASSRQFRPALTVWFGRFYDGHLTQWLPQVGWSSPRGHLLLELSGELDVARLRAGEFTDRLLGLRAVYAFTPDVVLSSFTQYDSTSSALGTNNLLRWTIRPGRDVYLVLNRSWNRRPGRGLGFAPEDDQIRLKVRWTFWW
ncbi:MAG: DUF5916 domain-containing protein [Thermoanaerobaculia bacterium]